MKSHHFSPFVIYFPVCLLSFQLLKQLIWFPSWSQELYWQQRQQKYVSRRAR